ncbi:MAG TPA: protein kinase [Polyangiaceae bacterium]|nr:protein kinase [Polyangiaceae bacterium]
MTEPVDLSNDSAEGQAAIPAEAIEFDADAATGQGLRYRPLFGLGEGGMAKVLLAVGRGPSGFNKLVVLKAMRRELVSDSELRQMFLAEARLSARLNNANVVQVYQVVDTAVPCIVMEYLDGQPLSTIYDRAGEQFTLPMQLKVISDALNGLHYSHELRDFDGTPLSIVHRDISPQNIFVTYDGVVKLLDFGIAKGRMTNGQTRTGVIKGKIPYMPPEQLFNEDVDRRADVYAAGCMLWRAASGVRLWKDGSDADVMRAAVERKLPKPSDIRAVDPRLEAIVMKALAYSASDRYATALDLQSAIDGFLHEAFPPMTMRAVAELVANVFSEERARRQEQIRQALDAPPSEGPREPYTEGLEQIIQFAPAVTRNEKAADRKPRGFWIPVAAGGSLLLLVVAGGFVLKSPREEPATAVSSPAPPPARVEVRIEVDPEGASLTVDGEPLSESPARLSVIPDNREHEIRVSKAGYEPYTRTMQFDRNVTLEVTLKQLPVAVLPASSESVALPPPAPKDSTASKEPPKRRPSPAPAKPKTDCDPPFYYVEGIKNYKPGCL